MDPIEFPTEIVEETVPSFGKEIAKSFAISTVTSAGVLAGFVVVGFAVTGIEKLRAARKAKKAAIETPTEEN